MAKDIQALLMATRRVYQQQFLRSGLPINDDTLGFLPAHALSRIAEDYPNWTSSGTRFNNVSDRPRNPANQADAHELEAIDWFRLNPQAKERVTDIRDQGGRQFLHYTTPIWTERYCLTCHGQPDQAPTDIKNRYKESYGYAEGDLRGVMSIKIPLQELRDNSMGLWYQSIAQLLVGYAALFLVLGFLVSRLITRRVAGLEEAARSIAQGDYGARARIHGNDEIARLGHAINHMSGAIQDRDETLRESEERFRVMAEQSNDWVWSLDSDGRPIYSNGRVRALLGLDPGQWSQLSPESRLHPDDLPLYRATWEHARTRRTGWSNVVLRWRHEDGTYRHLESSATLRSDSQGRILGWQGADRDITLRAHTENAIHAIADFISRHESTDLFPALVEHAARIFDADYVHIGRITPDGDQIETLAAWLDGAPIANYRYPLAKTPCAQVVKLEHSCHTRDVQQRFPEDGDLIKLHAESYVGEPILDTDGKAFGLIVIVNRRILSEERVVQAGLRILAAKAATELRRQSSDEELRIAAVAFNSLQGILVTDAHTVIQRVNASFEEATGYTQDEVIGRTPSLLKSGRHGAGFYQAMWASLTQSDRWQGEIWNRRKNGETFPEWLSITAVRNQKGQLTHYVGIFEDITARKLAEDQIRNLAFYDTLTGLANRRLLQDRLMQACAASSRHMQYGALLFIDLDNFKTLNDTLGHGTGDKLLVEVARRLNSLVREEDTVSRLGGDEFIVMLEELGSQESEALIRSEFIAEKLLNRLNHLYSLDGREIHSSPSIGVVLFRGKEISLEELLRRADMAMYQAKASGRNTIRFFDPDMQARLEARTSLEAEMRRAVGHNQFLLHYQPQVSNDGTLVGVEALVRWQHPEKGLLSPAQFIPLAEECGLIQPIGHTVLVQACSLLALWKTQEETRHLVLAVNVSARQFRHPDFVDQILAVVEHTGANPAQLKLELTESLLLDDVEDTIEKMTSLGASGIQFSLDDFGTGYSSLTYLKRLPLSQIKIDRAFVRDVLTDASDAAIAKTIIGLSETFGISVIAEGVETPEQQAFLAQAGCHLMQGYLFGKPMPYDQFKGRYLTP